MKVSELITILSTMQPDVDIEVNDNNGGEVYAIDQVDFFPATDGDPSIVMIQVNCG